MALIIIAKLPDEENNGWPTFEQPDVSPEGVYRDEDYEDPSREREYPATQPIEIETEPELGPELGQPGLEGGPAAPSGIDQMVSSIQEVSGRDPEAIRAMSDELGFLIMLPDSSGKPLIQTISDDMMGTAWERLPNMVSKWRGDPNHPFENYFRSFLSGQAKRIKVEEEAPGRKRAVMEMKRLDPYINAVRWGRGEDKLVPDFIADQDEWNDFEKIRESYIWNRHEFRRSKGLGYGAGPQGKKPNYFRNKMTRGEDVNEELSRSPSRTERAMAYWNRVGDNLAFELSKDRDLFDVLAKENNEVRMFYNIGADGEGYSPQKVLRYIFPRGANSDSKRFQSVRNVYRVILKESQKELASGSPGKFTKLVSDIGLSPYLMFTSPGVSVPGKEDEYSNGGEYYLNERMVSPKHRLISDWVISERSKEMLRGKDVSMYGPEGRQMQLEKPTEPVSAPVGLESEEQKREKSVRRPVMMPDMRSAFHNAFGDEFANEYIREGERGKPVRPGGPGVMRFPGKQKYSLGLDILSEIADNTVWQYDNEINKIKSAIAEQIVLSPNPMKLYDKISGSEELKKALGEELQVTLGRLAEGDMKNIVPPEEQGAEQRSTETQKFSLIVKETIEDLVRVQKQYEEAFRRAYPRAKAGEKVPMVVEEILSGGPSTDMVPNVASISRRVNRLEKFKLRTALLGHGILRAEDDIADMFGTGVKGYVARLLMNGADDGQVEKAVLTKFENEIASRKKESFESMLFDVKSKMRQHLEQR